MFLLDCNPKLLYFCVIEHGYDSKKANGLCFEKAI